MFGCENIVAGRPIVWRAASNAVPRSWTWSGGGIRRASTPWLSASPVTPQTIRRDINELCAQKLLQRYHGGAGLPSSVENLAYLDRQVMNLEAKQRIARLVAAHPQSCLAVHQHRHHDRRGGAGPARACRVAGDHQQPPGGEPAERQAELRGDRRRRVVRSRDRGIVGEAAIDLIRQFRVDYGMIGISGIDLDGSLLDYDYREVRVAQAIIANSRAGVPRRRPHQVRPQRDGAARRDRAGGRAVHGRAAAARHRASAATPPR